MIPHISTASFLESALLVSVTQSHIILPTAERHFEQENLFLILFKVYTWKLSTAGCVFIYLALHVGHLSGEAGLWRVGQSGVERAGHLLLPTFLVFYLGSNRRTMRKSEPVLDSCAKAAESSTFLSDIRRGNLHVYLTEQLGSFFSVLRLHRERKEGVQVRFHLFLSRLLVLGLQIETNSHMRCNTHLSGSLIRT